MDKLLEHIERTAEKERIRGKSLRDFVQSFLHDFPRQWQAVKPFDLPYSRDTILEVMDRCLAYESFERGRGPDYTRGQIQARIERGYGRNEGWLATVEGLLSERLELRFEIRIAVDDSGRVTLEVSNYLPTWVEEYLAAVRRELVRTPPEPGEQEQTPGEQGLVLGPGEELRGAHAGRLLDYSGCATRAEVEDLVKRPGDDKVLPLGIYAFDLKPELAGDRPALFLSRYRTGALMAYNGTLIVAPQNAGKTELIVRWALAANRGGYNTFIVDVKGNMHERLMREGLRGRVCYFSTDPDPDLQCDRLNFLEGLDTRTAAGRKEIDQVVQAILPREGNEEGEDQDYWRVRTKWLAAFLNIRKLFDLYYNTTSDLGSIYELASDEAALYRCLRDILRAEQYHRENNPGRPLPEPGVRHWIGELAVLIDPNRDDIPGGQREPRYTYQTLTINIATALQPFCKYGTLYARTSGQGDFTLKDLDGQEQVTIILAAREQDMEDSRTVVSMAIKRLEQILFDRRKKARPERDILLLLDETRRIRSFKAGEYITFARDAKAGCVLVYQSISQIRSKEEINEILENVGTQIYLRSLVGDTAKHFIEMLPRRQRPTFSRSISSGPDGRSTSIQTGQELVDYFTTGELYRLPAGDYPALVYIKDHSHGKPFLVDMSHERLAQSGQLKAISSKRSAISKDKADR